MNSNKKVVQREKKIRQYWAEANTFKQSIQLREGKTPFVFYEGPPTANGLPHVGHAFGRTIKDVVARFKTMKGFQVERKAGWDTHGLPVELGVEKQLGISGKQDIERYGVESFINKCKESVFAYEKIWRSFTEELGYWVDMDSPYLTLSNEYIESVWHILSRVHKNGLLYKGHRVSPYCPSCQTSLSTHEVAQGYKNVKDLSATVKFKRLDAENEYFLGWTTTPWTLPANVALAMNPSLTYVRAQKEDEIYIVAKSLVNKVLGDRVNILSEHSGKEFAGTHYDPPFHYIKVEKGHFVVLADFVTEESGTGIVHIAPAYGEDDYKLVQQNGLSFVNVVDQRGCYTPDVVALAGKFVKDCDVEIIKMLAELGTLFHKEKYEHSYPHCWRCDSPLLYYATDSWFIKMSALKDKMLTNNGKVIWYPDHIKDGRFGRFLENLLDWNISRNRYWGTPLNIWVCTHCHHEEAPASIKELQNLASKPISGNIELHKPYIDDVQCTCPKCNNTMLRTPEVIDVWFDSGSMPFAQHHYPFENKKAFQSQFPADVVIEGIDQTRGFFYSLLAVSTLYTGQPPYKNVLSLGHILDEHGQKMSKSKGNALDPIELMYEYGADALRWSFLVDSSPWNPKRYSKKIVQDAKSKLVDTLDNTYKFYDMYTKIDHFVYDEQKTGKRSILDKWILSRLNSTVKVVNKYMEQYQFTQATREIAALVDELSNWYIRRSRSRFWASGFSEDKRAAYSTLFEALTTISRLLAPFVPYIAEDIHLKLHQESVHLQNYPTANTSVIQSDLETDMQTVLKIVELGRSIRNANNLKVKQPLQQLIVWCGEDERLLQTYTTIIKEELNVKEVVFTKELTQYEKSLFKVNFKTAGTAFGKYVNAVKQYVDQLSDEEKKIFIDNGQIPINLDGQQVVLRKEHVTIEQVMSSGMVIAGDHQLKVLLDIKLTPELVDEGHVREFIRAIQETRKKLNLPVEMYISIKISASDKIKEKLQLYDGLIKENVLVHTIEYGNLNDDEQQIEMIFDKEIVKTSLIY
ncbi:isoleucyl-tRNA synthetase [Heyndrickxia shackletonii]|uniref:Isoleucine--tRNA ligase n=1 Tax=Heyndrickxia shackletonii TaxID=157838 RepID=A0A0Q3WSD6_9BACI|nr:isoleucine--tRNA ligase [Heyndrickxia shackletonii]KQL50879.1 isoleucyl-tRNA synthetase [Heyndrickxia shackletonii]NEZ01765.1 isoleucine--tRNA ligase [Heyndrickxia shackletonii]